MELICRVILQHLICNTRILIYLRYSMKIDQNFVALITGGASGLGQATVRLFRTLKANVVIADLNQEHGNKIAQELGHQKTLFIKTDVTNEDNIKKTVDRSIQKFGKIHLLLNCAGVIHAKMFVSSKGLIQTKELQLALKINVIGTFNFCKYVAQKMVKQQQINGERGLIVNVASVAGFEGQKGQTVYSATKGAIIGMTMPMARDLGKFGIRVMTIAPGIFETPMAVHVPPKVVEVLKNATVLGRNGAPHEFALLIQSMCQNGFASGVTWRLDGGVVLPNL